MANRVLGIEFSPESIKLVEVGFGRRLKVFNFAIVDNRAIDPNRRVDQLNHTLQVRGFEAKDAVVAVNAIQVEHKLLTLPPLSGRELRFVMQREAKKSSPAGATDTYWDFQLLRAKEELGIKKRQILLVTAATNAVTEAREFFGRTRLNLQKVTTVGEALLSLTQHIGYWKKETVKTIVHFGTTSVHVLFVQDRAILLCRDLPISYGDVDPQQRADRLMTEIKRSTLYFRQNFPQRQVDEILFSGESDMIGSMVSRANEDLGTESNVLRFDDNLDSASFKGEWDEFRFHIPSLSAAFGVAWHKTPETGVNLLPGKASFKEGPPIYQKLIKVAAIITLAVFLAAGFRYFMGSRQLRADQLDIEARIAELEPKLAEGAAALAQRDLALTRRAFMGRMASGTGWEEAFRSLSIIVPDTAIFGTIQIEGGDSPALVITGYLRSGLQGQATADFNQLFEELRGLEHFSSVEMSQPLSVSYENVELTDSEGGPTTGVTSRATFEVRCLLKSKL